MAKITVRLGDADFEVPRLTFGQYEQLTALSEGPRAATGADSLRFSKKTAEILLQRAAPPVGDLSALECSPVELRIASEAIMRANGLIKDAESTADPAGSAEGKDQAAA